MREYNDHLAVVECSEEEIKCFLVESSRKAAAAKAAEAQQARRLSCSERRFKRALEEKAQLISEMHEKDKEVQDKLNFLERFKVLL